MRSLLFLLLFVSGITCTYAQQMQLIDKVVVQVGSELVLLSDIEDQYSLMVEQQGVVQENARCLILEGLMINNLLVNHAVIDSVTVEDNAVEDQLNARIDQILGMMDNDVQRFEEFYGQTVTDIRNRFRDDLKKQMLTEKMQQEIMSDITVTPNEVVEFFHRIPKDSLPYFHSEVEISEIVVKPEVNAIQRQIAIDQLEKIRKEIIEDGRDFAEMAGIYSDDGSARSGGDLGWQKRGTFVPEFEAAAYILENNELSEIVETKFGFHLIQLLGRRGNTIHTRHILVKPNIVQDDLEKTRSFLDSIRLLIMADSISFTLAVKRHSDESSQSYNNNGRVVNPKTGNTFFEVGDLDTDVYFAIDTL